MTSLDERYGTATAGARTRVVVAVAVVLVGAGLSWLVWVMLQYGRPDVQSSLVSFDTRGEHATVATFEVVRSEADVEASCLLRAFAADHAIVGEANVVVGPGGPLREQLTETIRTEREATAVEAVGCRTPDQPRRG